MIAARDAAFMSTSAGTPLVIPAGLLHGVTLEASSGADADSVRQDIRTLLAEHRLNCYGASGAVLVMAADRAAALATMGTDDGATAFPGIGDRTGVRILRDPTDKPFVKFYTTKRVAGGLADSNAIKLLKFSET